MTHLDDRAPDIAFRLVMSTKVNRLYLVDGRGRDMRSYSCDPPRVIGNQSDGYFAERLFVRFSQIHLIQRV